MWCSPLWFWPDIITYFGQWTMDQMCSKHKLLKRACMSVLVQLLSAIFMILFMGFSRQECWNGSPFPSPVDYVLSELSTMTHPSWVALQSMTHSFTWLDLFLGRKEMTKLDSILKNRNITLATKVCIVKAMVFPLGMCEYASWTIKKALNQRIDAFELWCWGRLLRVPWTARRSN